MQKSDEQQNNAKSLSGTVPNHKNSGMERSIFKPKRRPQKGPPIIKKICNTIQKYKKMDLYPITLKIKKMYKPSKATATNIQTVKLKRGETIEQKVRRIKSNDEPIKDGVEASYTEREDGVPPDNDPRTDKWDAAIGATDKAAKNTLTQRELRIGEKTYDTMDEKTKEAFHKKFKQNKHTDTWAKEQAGKKGKEGGA